MIFIKTCYNINRFQFILSRRINMNPKQENILIGSRRGRVKGAKVPYIFHTLVTYHTLHKQTKLLAVVITERIFPPFS